MSLFTSLDLLKVMENNSILFLIRITLDYNRLNYTLSMKKGAW
jgi:hypothetical protein